MLLCCKHTWAGFVEHPKPWSISCDPQDAEHLEHPNIDMWARAFTNSIRGGICLHSHFSWTINHPPPHPQRCTGLTSTVHPHPSDPPVYPHGLQRSSTVPTLRSTGSHFGASGGEGRERTPPQSLRNLRTLSITDYYQRSSQIIIGKVNSH